MKKNITYLAIFLLLLFAGCKNMPKTRTVFETSKAAYQSINSANEMVQNFASDVYDAWLKGIYDDDELKKDGLDHMKWELHIGPFLPEAAAMFYYPDEWSKLPEDSTIDEESEELMSEYNDAMKKILTGIFYYSDEKKELIEKAESNFKYKIKYSDSIFSYCVNMVTYAYQTVGETASIQGLLDDAKAEMRHISEKYSDYEHYPMLKQYYTSVSALFDFCQNPSGSFEQMKTTIEEYRRKIRDCKNDLDYLFLDD